MNKKSTYLRWHISLILIALCSYGFAQSSVSPRDSESAIRSMDAISATLNESFEGELFPPEGWKVISDGDPNKTWVRANVPSYAHSGSHSARIDYSSTTAHDDWLITPRLSPVEGNSIISFYAVNSYPAFRDEFNVKLSTTGNNKEDFTVTLASNVAPGALYVQYSYDLAAYNGQAVYVAVQAISLWKWTLWVDDFVGPTIYSGPAAAPVAATNISPLDGVTNVENGSLLIWEFGDNTLEYELVLGTTYPPSTVVVPYTTDLATSYTLAGLQPNMQYFWRVNAKNTEGITEGPLWGFTTTVDVPDGLTATVVDPNPTAAILTVNLDWNGPSDRGFIGYNVYRNNIKLNSDLLTTSAYTDNTVARNETYSYSVTNVFDEGESAPSVPVSITTKGVGIFTGFIYDQLTNAPIEGARVNISGTEGNYSVLTAANGSYSTQAYSGTYSIGVSADDYISQSLANVTLAHGVSVSNDFSLIGISYAVTEVTATELDNNSVHISWTVGRDINSFDVWREKIFQPGALEKIGTTLGQNEFVDFSWSTMDWGAYRWAVTVNYDDNTVSPATFSNALDKDMNTVVNVAVALNSGDSPFGTEVTFTNISEPDLALVYSQTLNGLGQFTWNEFRKGVYDIAVFKAGYTGMSLTDVNIFDNESFEWLLEEILAPPTGLFVTPTGLATWAGDASTPFEPFLENFDAVPEGTIPEGWSRSPETNNWAVHNGTQAGGIANQMRFYWSPSGVNQYYLKTPVMSTTGQSSLQLSFKHNIDDYSYGNSYDLRVVAIADGVEYIIHEWINPTTLPSTTEVFDLTSAHGLGAAEFQIAWIFDGNTFDINNWYLDDVSLMGSRAPDSFQAYRVFHNGVVVANITDAQYQYGANGEALVDGETYLAEVATNYSTGQSPRISYTWTYVACENYATPGNFAAEQVEGTINVDLSWTIPTIPEGDDQIDFARITRDGEVIIETENANYMDTNLNLGSYTYCITFVYESGAETCPATLCETVGVIGGGFVNGNVKEAAYLGGANIAGAEVTLTNTTDNTIVFTFTTNASGNYTGEVLAGNYNYRVEAEGYDSQTLANIDIAQTAIVVHNFVLMEFPYAVGDIVATEITDSAVEVNWSGTGGGGGGGVTTSEWLIYDNDVMGFTGIGSELSDYSLTWASKFVPAQLTEYGDGYVTKVSLYQSSSAGDYLTEVRILGGQNGETILYTQDVTGTLTGDVWNIIELDQAIAFDNTENLWIAMYVERPGDTDNEPTAGALQVISDRYDYFAYNGAPWTSISSEYGITNQAWMLRGFVTTSAGREVALDRGNYNADRYTDYSSEISVPSGKGMIAATKTNAKFPVYANESTRAFQGFNVYRTTCETSDLQFLGYTLDSLFTDNTWGAMEPGVYKWGVEAVYDENNSEIRFSNCLDKDMVTAVSVTVLTNSGDSPDRTDVKLTNISEPGMNLVYEVRLDDTGYFIWEDFRKGTYDVVVEKNGFAPIMETVDIDGPTNLSYLLEELLTPVADLHVSATGFAKWRDGGIQPFDAIFFDFEADEQGWEIQGNVDGWQWGNNASLSSNYMNFNGNSTNFIAVNADASGQGGAPIVASTKSPVMNLENAEQIYLSFDYKLNIDALAVLYSINGGDPVQIENLPLNPNNWTNHMVMLPEEALVENVQIIFKYTEASTWSYGAGVDNVALTEEQPDNRAFDYYKVWLNGIFVTNTTDTFWQYNPATLIPGQEYFTEVAAVYSNGMSEKMDYTWTYYPCDSFPGPTDLAYEVVDVNNVVLTWGGSTPPPPPPGDGFSDDFEAHENFAIEFAPWTNVDVDGSPTYGMTGIHWPNTYQPQSFIVYNPSATTPPLDGTTAHSGNKFVACFAAENAPNNDWLISPQVTIEAGYTVSFWAKSYTADYGLERFKVGVSTTGLNPSDFTIITSGDYVQAPAGDWTQFSYELNSYAGQSVYVAIQCVSNDAFFLMVDDFAVGAPTAAHFAFNPSVTEMGSASKVSRESEIRNASADFDSEMARLLVDSKAFTGKSILNRANDILWNENWEDPQASTDGIVSTYFGGISAPTYSADDFTVPAGKEWVVSSLWARGFVSAGLPDPQGFGYTIFADANGAPGAVLYEELNAGANNPDNVQIDLATPITLTEGTYWVSIYAYYANASGTAQGRWNQYMWNPASTPGNPAMLNDIAGLFGGTTGFQTLISLGVDFSTLDFAVVGESQNAGGGGGGGTFDPGEFLGANVYRDGLLIAEMVQGETYTDMEVEPGYYDYCVVFVYEDNAMSCMTTCVTDVLVTEDCQIPQNLIVGQAVQNEVILEWNKQVATEFRYDDGTSTGQLGFSGGTINGVLGARHDVTAEITELSWYTTSEGGPHNTVQVYVFGLTSAGMPNGGDVLYTASVSNTDDSWNTHTLPNSVTADGGFYIALGYNGFAGLGTDDGVGAPYVYQNNTHYYASDYTTNAWTTFESSGFSVNAMIRAIGMTGAKASYAIAPEMEPVNDKSQMSVVYITNNPVATGSPQWSAPARNMNRELMGYNIYRNGSLLEALWPETTYIYQEANGGESCYTVTAEYEYCGETDPSNEVCIVVINTEFNDLSQIRIYPNPTNSMVNIELTSNISQVVIYNYLGQVVYENNITDETILPVDVSNYESGAYLVKFITNQGQSLTKKVVVTK